MQRRHADDMAQRGASCATEAISARKTLASTGPRQTGRTGNGRINAQTQARRLGIPHGCHRCGTAHRARQGALDGGDTGPVVIEVADEDAPAGEPFGDVSHESFLAHGDPHFIRQLPDEEWNYTTCTGKIHKFMLREPLRSASVIG